MSNQHLYVLWKDNLPSRATNVYRVEGNIDYDNNENKFIFKIPNGSVVRIKAEQIIQIGISGNVTQLNESQE